MKKIAIRFSIDDDTPFDLLKKIALDIQRFIIEGDYKISSIITKLREHQQLELDVGMENNMPEFTELTKEFDTEGIEYILYKSVNEGWKECELDDLELDRRPKWIYNLVGLNLLWYMVMTVLQFFFIYEWYSEKYEWGGIVSAIAAFFTGLVPVFGSLVAYWSVTELSDWEGYKALWAFFVYYIPLLGFFLYLGWIVIKALYRDRWYRFWRPEFN
ncbi:MAG: Unknown protein [uncultured Sulfurovum sp.]|uniref:Uncharacterized protein n=1 Tax=uncultured Sulfurovum sp. TaxID=269237 RepID=A0A6S6T1Q4_9BACT|nr:MAG: Unknown protein [uncultured Sulfurovum sp.]